MAWKLRVRARGTHDDWVVIAHAEDIVGITEAWADAREMLGNLYRLNVVQVANLSDKDDFTWEVYAESIERSIYGRVLRDVERDTARCGEMTAQVLGNLPTLWSNMTRIQRRQLREQILISEAFTLNMLDDFDASRERANEAQRQAMISHGYREPDLPPPNPPYEPVTPPPPPKSRESGTASIKKLETCPDCGGKVQRLGQGARFCLDCDWDELKVI